MSNAPTGIKNVSLEDLALPSPYDGMLPAGQMAIVADSPTGAMAALGGVVATNRILQFIVQPTGAALSSHGAQNVDETLATASPAVSLVTQVSRFDVLSGPGNMTPTLGDGIWVGQRKRLYQMSATGAATVVVTPTHMAESKTSVTLKALGAWCDLDWQQAGWKLSAVGGLTGGSVTLA